MKSNIIPKGMHCVFATGDKDFLPRANGRRFLLLAASSVATIAAAFDNAAGWKKDADGKLALDADGNPIYVNSAGAEQSVKGDTISTLNAEAKKHREDKEKAEALVAKYRGPDGKQLDPDIAVKAVETVGKLDAKKLIDAGEVDKLTETIKSQFTTQLGEKDAKIGELDSTVKSLRIDKAFDSSEFVRERLAVPPDMFRDSFGKNVKIGDDGKLEYYGRDGNRLLSKKNAGEYATGDEAFELMVEQHPQKDTIMKAPAAGGSGNGGGGGARGGGNVMKRGDFDNLSVGEKASVGQKVAAGEMQIVD